MKTRHLLLLLCVSFFGLTLHAADSKVPADQARLQGEWSMVSGVADGSEIPESMRKNSRRVCKGTETTVMVGSQVLMKATFSLDPSQSPKAIDYQSLDGPTKGSTLLGIYEFDGDKVKFCFGQPGAARPTRFASVAGDRQTFTIWTRTAPVDSK